MDDDGYDLDNSGIRYGKYITEILDGTREPKTEAEHLLKITLPCYQYREHELIVPMYTPRGVVKLLIRMDTFSQIDWAFREYKTGRNPWTLAKATKHIQNRFYSLALFLLDKSRGVPVSHLDWIETEEDEETEVVTLTGKIVPFKTTASMVDVLTLAQDITKVAYEIDELMRARINSIL